MASSQKDIFEDSDEDFPRMSFSMDTKRLKRGYVYDKCILFDWNPDNQRPFQSYNLSIFNEKDFKSEWIQKNLGFASRIMKLSNLSPFPGGVYSLFAKFESGIHASGAKRLRITYIHLYIYFSSFRF